ncbi:IS5 family transposase [Noviherbaspirillum sp. 1P10PC]|uniref:IS5 family transposase n=1 Tax=Noviherbaspirillum sp. 1P10PC TaxID=3132292 RepID=UPI0039A1BAB3
MWTKEHRAKALARTRELKRYPSDLTDDEWLVIAPLMPAASRIGRPRSVDLREVINAIRYLVRSGCEWRMLPRDLPPWQTVYWWFRRFVRRLLFRVVHDIALMMDRLLHERNKQPSAGVLDSQAVKAPASRERGYDANKKITGRKRHIAVDTDGRLLMVNLTTASISNSAGAQQVLDALKLRWPWPRRLFADSAYDRRVLLDKAAFLDFIVEVVRKVQDQHTFVLLPRRWVVERTFGWMMRWRRLVRDYEQRVDVSRQMIYVATGSLLLKRLFDTN